MLRWSNMEAAGFIIYFCDETDPRPAREQINEAYSHGGGWQPFDGFTFNYEALTLSYPGDPIISKVKSRAKLRDEELILFQYDWLVIRQPNGSWEVARVD